MPEINEAFAALQSRQFGWNTFKFVGAEIQQTTDYAINAIGRATPQQYVEQVKAVVFDSNHIANGYNNMPLDASTQQRCDVLGWDCTGSMHRAPNVQHFIGWIATCGYLCSGNPSDGYVGIDTGWGWVHELGHNTVQRVLSMTFKASDNGANIGCGTECDNNILAGLSMMRKYALFGQNNNGANFNHPMLYGMIKDNRASNLTGEALRLEMENRLWRGNDGAKQAVHIQLAYLYSHLVQHKAQPDVQGVFEFIRLLNSANRLVNQLDISNEAERRKFGLTDYTAKDFSTPDLVYMLSSKIMGYDLKAVFSLYGLPVSNKAHQSIAKLGLATAPLKFYAQKTNGANILNEGQWLDLAATGSLPNYLLIFKTG